VRSKKLFKQALTQSKDNHSPVSDAPFGFEVDPDTLPDLICSKGWIFGSNSESERKRLEELQKKQEERKRLEELREKQEERKRLEELRREEEKSKRLEELRREEEESKCLEELQRIRKCKNCEREFTLETNNENTCKYHQVCVLFK